MRNERGFTLVEVLASITILAILATIFFQMFVFSQKTTTTSKEKLVALNVAQGVLERVKHGVHKEIDTQKTYNLQECNKKPNGVDCNELYNSFLINGVNYKVEIIIGEKDKTGLDIYWATVNVYDGDGEEDDKPLSSVEGFVEL
ncbi:type IV pilus modification PilV family protein [Bacillus marasmi]|uniref:type IV pilus modification PilV family protein n=1 Tax=Bacillus marasmi TaxID=1926279 RepID=UPI0011C9445D|nr:type II secretion system protein [Bacillus marasmi]